MHSERPFKAAPLAVFCGAALVLQSASLSKSDQRFMKTSAETDMMAAHLGQMAESQSSHQNMKDFGKKLSMDHTNSYGGLSVLSNKTGETIPKALKPDKTIDHLAHLKGASFDHEFIMQETRTQKAAVTAFKNEAEHGENSDVKAWANSMLPTLEADLQTAESLAKSGGTAKTVAKAQKPRK